MRSILALDPGLTSGVAFLTDAGGTPQVDEVDFDGACRRLEAYGRRWMTAGTIVCESYRITARTAQLTQQTWSLELIGVARWVSRQWCGRDLVLQSPGQAKGFSTDAKLRALGWYRPTRGGHQNDAQRHLLLWAVRTGMIDPAALVGVEG